MSSAPDPSKEIKVTNSTQSALVLMLPTSSQTADANATLVYHQALEILAAVDGTTSMPAGATKTYVLNQSFVDPVTGKSSYLTIYDLLPSTASWYLPVANIPVMQSFPAPGYKPQTVTPASAAALRNAATFVQTIAAYPTSALATGYQQALGSAQGKASAQANGSASSSGAAAQSIASTVNAFFKGTKSYQDVTLESVVAIQSYYATFPFVWAHYATAAITYYLYSSNGSATSFVGTIALTRPAKLDATRPNAGYTCTFTPASTGSDTTTVAVTASGAKSLTYQAGLFVDATGSDVPAIGVKGTFQIKSLFTGKLDDTDIITVLTGTVNGSVCIGFDSPQLSSDPNSSFWDTLFHPKTAAQIFQSVMEIGGFLMLVAFVGQTLYSGYKWLKGLSAAKEPTTAELLDQHFQKLQESMQASYESANAKLSGGRVAPAPDAEAAAGSVQAQTDVVSASESANRLLDGYDAQAQSLQDLAAFEESMTGSQIETLDSLAGRLRDSYTALAEADPAELGAVVEEQSASLKSLSADFADFKVQLSEFIGASEEASFQANIEAVNDALADVDKITQDNADTTGEADPEAEPIELPDVFV